MYLAPALASILTGIVCLFAWPLGKSLNVLDFPDNKRKRHKVPTPLIGGLAIVAPLLGTGIYLCLNSTQSQIFIAICIAIAGAFIIGFLDDKYDVSPAVRLFLTFILCIGFLSNHPQLIVGILHFSIDNYSLSVGRWAWPLTLLSVLGFIYSFNMTDGMNGLAIGQALIWSVLLCVLSNGDIQWFLITSACVLSVAFYFNIRGKVFLGDSGAYALSAMFAVIMIHSYMEVPSFKFDIIIIWTLIPIVDCCRLIITRIASGTSPLSPDENHFHHLLSTILPSNLTVPTILASLACAGALTITLPEHTILWLGISLALYILVLIITAIKRQRSRTI